MGLDQYLSARRRIDDEGRRAKIKALLVDVTDIDDEDEYYLSMWDHAPAATKALSGAVVEMAGLSSLRGEESNSAGTNADASLVWMTAIYWRKANAVHGWFVENCQGGEDECERHDVHPEQLCQLAHLCEQALAAYRAGNLDEARALMTPRAGFFFGGTDLDDWWAENMAYSATEIRRVIEAAARIGGCEFFYESSW